jgi:hypothetical protein
VDLDVRAEAAIAALTLGADQAAGDVARLLQRPVSPAQDDGLSRPRRAALALARLHAPAALPVLGELAGDVRAQEADRLKAVEALGTLGEGAQPALIAALAEVRLREAAAHALGRDGGAAGAEALLAQLAEERYEPARRAEVEALAAMRDQRVLPLLVRFLGTETSVPGGVRVLSQLGGLNGPSARGALLSEAGARAGSWRCTERGCAPEAGARIALSGKAPAALGMLRVTVWIGEAESGAVLHAGAASFRLQGGEQQVSFTLPRWQRPSELAVASEGEVALRGWVAVPETLEIPPPAPEPWDAGATGG